MNILFVSFDSSRTGAPILLRTLIQWLIKEKEVSAKLILLYGGELENDFRSLLPTYILQSKPSGVTRILNNLFPTFKKRIQTSTVRSIVESFNPDIIYFNTSATLPLVLEVPLLKKYKRICHVHELEYSIRKYAGKSAFREAIPFVDIIICASQAVANNLVNAYGADLAKQVVIPEPIDVQSFSQTVTVNIREKLGIGASDFVVVGSGSFDWRKAPEIFIQIASMVNKLSSKIQFIWVGKLDDHQSFMVQNDLAKLNLSESVHFVGMQLNPRDYFNSSDVFLLTSREDPFPLVCLEAAACRRPIVCFEDAGGMPEFVRDDAGIVVPYLDLEKVVEVIIKLSRDRELCESLGQKAKERVYECDIANIGPRIWEVLEKFNL